MGLTKDHYVVTMAHTDKKHIELLWLHNLTDIKMMVKLYYHLQTQPAILSLVTEETIRGFLLRGSYVKSCLEPAYSCGFKMLYGS